ncbi:hypothetical protein CU097_010525 [Rhizopus azygosporus]|uniref:Uncharacterized protein n=1 Tax=Rhizopus azygosporus TaxID=86630 RepID=A0A367JEK3_RHIAZ|nr:hypothetical protein CU097_010525 [Rhizopus azygosporus]CEG70014.1 hypothetical protein RMATCC62417_05989 [Rhizopus microsporus]
MYKTKTLAQQRALPKPVTKSVALFNDDSDDEENISMTDTLLLAQFLSTTGPEEYFKEHNKKQLNRASRLLKKLRKRPSTEKYDDFKLPMHSLIQEHNVSSGTLREASSFDQETILRRGNSNKHNPGDSINSNSTLRDSGVYSETSEKEPCMTLHEFHFPIVPHRPAPPPPTPTPSPGTTQNNLPTDIRTVPEAARHRRQVRIRHAQVQTQPSPEQAEDQTACPHCRQQVVKAPRTRRTSCPPALASGPTLEPSAKLLMAMIEQLKNQLAQEKECRQKLEQAMYQKERKEQLELEKTKWANECRALDKRLAMHNIPVKL